MAVESDLRGRLYVAVDAERHELVEDREATVLVGDEVIDAFGGCNPDSTVAYTLRGGALKTLPYFGSDSAGTGCRPDIEEQDEWLYALIRSSPTVRVKDAGATLILATRDETVKFAARTRPQGRRTIPRRDLDRFHSYVEARKAGLMAKLTELNTRVHAGTLTRRQQDAQSTRFFDRYKRDYASAFARARATAR